MMHTAFPVDRQAPKYRAAKEDSTSAESQGFEDIRPATNAAIDVDFQFASNGLDHFGQRFNACNDTVELATTVVGDNNPSSSIGESKARIFCRKNAFE